MPVPQFKLAIAPRSNDSAAEDEYEFPQRIALDEASWRAFCSEMENPRPPNAALRALFNK
jgi:uncharacterized protein (DUF1778 family)